MGFEDPGLHFAIGTGSCPGGQVNPETLEHGLVTKETPAAPGLQLRPREKLPDSSAPDLRYPREGLMRVRLRKGARDEDERCTIVFLTPQSH